jgi:AAA domain
MTHPLFRSEIFIETAFEKRFQAMLRSAWQKQSWHVIVADPGSGKTMGIRDLIKTAGSPAVLAVTAPKNNEDEMALGNQFFSALGLPIRGRWSERKPKLIGAMVRFGVKCLIVDDAQDLSLEHLMLIKELTDQGRLQYNYPLGLCLVTAGRGNTIPLKEIFDRPDTMWLQFRRRLDKLEPFCRVVGHTSEEVREILAALETVYRELFPQLNLRQWTTAIYTWLTQPVLDPTNSGRVTMDYLMKLVTIALEWSYAAGETEVRAETLKHAAELLILRRDTLWMIDGAGPRVEAPLSEPLEQGNESETEPEQDVVSANHGPHRGETAGTVEEQVLLSTPPKCTFAGVVPIDLARFLASSVRLVECPDCGRARTLEPRGGALRFKSHTRRKTTTPATSKRWARIDSDWGIVGG